MISPNKRQAIFDRDGHACVRCKGAEALTIDHIWPRSKGGTDAEFNLQTLCARCNVKKGDSGRWSARNGVLVRRPGRA